MKIERPKPEEVIAQLKNNNFVINPYVGVAISSIIGFNAMMVTMFVSQSGYAGIFALLGAIGVVLSFIAGRAEYLLTKKGIYQSLTPFISELVHIKSKERFFPFELIYYYQIAEEVDRSMQTYKKLLLNLAVEPGKLILTNKKEPAQFEIFIKEFEVLIAKKNEGSSETQQANISSEPSIWDPPLIKKKKSFYKKPISKVIAILFLVVAIGLLLLSIAGMLSFSSIIRLYIFILPGTIFMMYMSFKKRE